MIYIGKKTDFETKIENLARRHWEWFADRIAYDKEETKLSDEEKEKLGNAIKINTALRKMLGPLYDELELIIKADYNQLQRYKSESKFVYCEQSVKEDRDAYELALEKWHQQNKVVSDLRKRKRYDKSLNAEYKKENAKKKKLLEDKQNKKDALDDLIAKNNKEWKRFCESTSCEIVLKKNDEDGQIDGGHETVKKSLFDLMGYKDFCNKDNKDDWNAYEMCKEMGVTVCPYCNRQYIFTIDTSNGCVRPQLDHFFPKSKYPLLACSFYNMIPSCPSCNTLKGDKDVLLVYPYEEEFGKNGCFEIILDDYLFIKTKKSIEDCITVKISLDECNDKNLKPKIEKAKEIFLLDELYNKHQIELKDLLFRYNYFRSLTRERLEKWGLIDEDMSLKDLLLGLPMMSGDDAVYPLKKMKEDIISQIESNDK